MQGSILLNYDANTHLVEKEEQDRFIRSLLDQMGVPVLEFWHSDEPLSVEQRIKLRELLGAYHIDILDHKDGHLQVFVERELIAEWHKATYKIKQDLSQLDRKKQLYLEMNINCWSVFEEDPST